ncbi:hypothetical protein GE21DRAFT_1077758 [Neurospora crassa]|nr:hypothetical protein GE21DRAFT_1077758 [Neurospora crassa]
MLVQPEEEVKFWNRCAPPALPELRDFLRQLAEFWKLGGAPRTVWGTASGVHGHGTGSRKSGRGGAGQVSGTNIDWDLS